MVTYTGQFSHPLGDAAEAIQAAYKEIKKNVGEDVMIMLPDTDGSDLLVHFEGGSLIPKKKKKKEEEKKEFSGAITLNVRNSTGSLKIFRTHQVVDPLTKRKLKVQSKSFQLAGCKNMIEASYVLTEILRAARAYGVDAIVETFRVELISLHLALGIGINQIDLKKHLQLLAQKGEFDGRMSFDNDTTHAYNGIMIKIPTKGYLDPTRDDLKTEASMSIFSTGTCIMWAKCPEDLLTMYSVLPIIDAAFDHVGISSDRQVDNPVMSWPTLGHAFPGLCHTHRPVSMLVPGCVYCALHGNCFADEDEDEDDEFDKAMQEEMDKE